MDKNKTFDAIYESIMGGNGEMEVTVVDMEPETPQSKPVDVAFSAIQQLGKPYKSGTLIDDGVYIEHGKYDKEEGIVINKVLTSDKYEGQGLADSVIKQIADLTTGANSKLFAIPNEENEGEDIWYQSLGFEPHEKHEGCMRYVGGIKENPEAPEEPEPVEVEPIT